MTEPEVKAAFAAFDPAHPFYRAAIQLLDDSILEEQDNVIQPGLPDGLRQFNSGRLAQAKYFRGVFLAVHQRAILEQAAEQAKMDREAARRAE